MPIYAPSDTLAALGNGLLPECKSRSLFQSRFADPKSNNKTNPTDKEWFQSLIKRSAENVSRAVWLPATAETLYARLMSRLMVDLGGGVMENANIKLDRYGLPLIPGSAVKGCARRMALQALHDWIEAQTEKGSAERPAADDACAPCCEKFGTPAEMLATIARVFGWVENDWKADKNQDKKTHQETTWKSDFAWAVGGNRTILEAAKAINPNFVTFAGTISFLAASPNQDPGLELDVVTPHHTKYYKGEKGFETAPDTEDAIPVFFPAVKAQGESNYFTFNLISLRLAKEGDVTHARHWLAHGLELLGLGAKTNTGYGWFDASKVLQGEILAKLKSAQKAEQTRRAQEVEQARQKEAEEAARRKKEEAAAATAGMTDDQKADYELSQLSPAQFENKVKCFFKEPKRGGPSPAEQKAIIRALRGSHLTFWQEFKNKSAKGGDFARAEQAIRTLNKQLNGDKMP